MRFRMLTLAVVGVFLTGCPQKALKCIEPPVARNDQDYKKAVDIGLQLEKLPVKGNLKVEFGDVVKTEFQSLNDENAAYALFLNAIDCYLRRGKVGEVIASEMARELMVIVKERWAARKGLMGTTPELSPIEVKLLSENAAGLRVIELTNRLLEKTRR